MSREWETGKPMITGDPTIKAFMDLQKIQGHFKIAAGYLEKQIEASVCVPNCGLCCKCNTVPAMTIEAMNIVSVMSGEARLKEVLDIAENWLLEKHSFTPSYEGMPIGLSSEKIKNEWMAMQSNQCPFLNEQLQCVIHSARPLVCYAYGVTRDAIDVCPRPLGRGESSTHHAYVDSTVIRKELREYRNRCTEENKTWVIAGPLPTMIFRAAREKEFRIMVHDNRIASAKLVGVEFETTLMWQPQMNAIREGISPELAMMQ